MKVLEFRGVEYPRLAAGRWRRVLPTGATRPTGGRWRRGPGGGARVSRAVRVATSVCEGQGGPERRRGGLANQGG